ncbi:hypothetical protein L2E82_34550 [Cichorium intybus]|uniref:Uncharacterized protein n=1 Tax=Cichorium intybus TaxID=13427 RepID=A0ACB9BME8_CICIN|nr:hypothetical protein L2E82_34550 [Cichorium intybus]
MSVAQKYANMGPEIGDLIQIVDADLRSVLSDDNVYRMAASEAFPFYNKTHLISLQFPARSADVCLFYVYFPVGLKDCVFYHLDIWNASLFFQVVGVPVTLNGDHKNQFVQPNVGFDTICKVNSQLISNVCTYALSAKKYYYFIRLMGRKASHVALECTLQSHPNMVILGEEVAASKLTIFNLTEQICDAVQARAEQAAFWSFVLTSSKHYLGKCGCVWFDRSEAKDREIVARKLREHVEGADNNPLFIFPEGMSVNNHYSVMFKKVLSKNNNDHVCPLFIYY